MKIELELVEQILNKANEKKDYKNTLASQSELKKVMDLYKQYLKRAGLDPAKDTRLYKLILRLCMNKAKDWKKALQDKINSQNKWIKAICHYNKQILYRHFFYWIYTVKNTTLRNIVMPKQINDSQIIKSHSPYKENISQNSLKRTPIAQNLRKNSPFLNRSMYSKNSNFNTKTTNTTRMSAQKKYQYFMEQELKYKKIKSQRLQTLLNKGFKGFIEFCNYKKSKRKIKNKLIEDCIVALEFYDKKLLQKTIIGLIKNKDLQINFKKAMNFSNEAHNRFLIKTLFYKWLQRFSIFSYNENKNKNRYEINEKR